MLFQVDIDEILEQAETREMDDHKGVGDELLSQFKIVTFDNLEEDEIAKPNDDSGGYCCMKHNRTEHTPVVWRSGNKASKNCNKIMRL